MTGDTNAEAYKRHANELVHFATGLVGPDDAPDVVMEATMRAFASPHWAQVEDRRAYLYRCVLNLARSHHRSTLARRAREHQAAAPSEWTPPVPDPDVLAASRLELVADPDPRQHGLRNIHVPIVPHGHMGGTCQGATPQFRGSLNLRGVHADVRYVTVVRLPRRPTHR